MRGVIGGGTSGGNADRVVGGGTTDGACVTVGSTAKAAEGVDALPPARGIAVAHAAAGERTRTAAMPAPSRPTDSFMRTDHCR